VAGRCIAAVAPAYLICKDLRLWEASYRMTAGAATAVHGPATQHGCMDIRTVTRPIFALALAAAGSAFAQSTSPSVTTPSVMASPPVMNDTTPLPAEERDSLGAIVLENSMVRAQRQAFAARHTSVRVANVGRGLARTQRKAQTKEELQQQHDDESLRLREMGAGALTPR
jgi:hypothetical protein